MSIILEIEGLDEILEALDLDVETQAGQAIDRLLTEAVDFARPHTPIDTGAMQAAWIWSRLGLEGQMEIDPAAVNPRSGALVSSYAPIVDARLGILEGAYQRVVTQDIEEIGW